MARYPAARWRPIPATWSQPTIRPTAAITHSAGGKGDLYGWWLNPAAGGNESHFWISYAGAVSQYVDTEIRADANGAANGFAISIETESTVQAGERWPPAQAVALILLIVWLVQTHGLPARIMTHPTDRGLAWHVQFGAPGPWTKARGKICPGPARIAQYQAEIIPEVARRVAAGLPSVPRPAPTGGFLMALTDRQQQQVLDGVAATTLRVQQLQEELVERTDDQGRTRADRMARLPDAVTALGRRLDQQQTQLDRIEQHLERLASP